MNQEIIDQILSCPALPSLPAVAVQVLDLTRRPDVSRDDLAVTIQNDQGLSAKVLKTVNSSFYGVRRPCSTINQAIVMLGMAAVKNLALSFSLVSAVNQDGSSEFDFPSYWRRGLYTAVAAKCIAHEAGLATEEEAFFGGLLQDVGMVGMFHGLQRQYLQVLLKTGGDHRLLVRHELAEFELQHPDIGAMMCERWKLPQELIMPVRFHERPTAAPPEHADLVRAVALGNTAHDILTDADPTESFRRFSDRAALWFDIDADACSGLIRRISDGARQVSTLFRLNIGASVDVEAILARAQHQRDALSRRAPLQTSHGASLGALLSDSQEFDALTGALTPSAALIRAAAAFASASAARKSLGVLIVGVDRFTALSGKGDQYAVDAVLAEAAYLLSETVEASGGLVSRWDNATFCLLLPGFDRSDVARAATEIRASIERESAGWSIPGGPFTVSIGAASLEPGHCTFARVEQLIATAARGMDAAAGAGGNCVRTFVPKLAA